MLHSRLSPQGHANTEVKIRNTGSQDNVDWMSSASASLTPEAPKLLLVGGAGVADFHVRAAQSHARRDLKPSFWSHCGVYLPGASGDDARIWHVSLEFDSGFSAYHGFSPAEVPSTDHIGLVPRSNGVLESTPELFGDKERWRNLALVEFAGVTTKALETGIRRARKARLQTDFVSPMVQWLGFVWGANQSQNPLLHEIPHPAASFVDIVYADAGVDIAPGMHDRCLCPESLWQTSKWWSDYYMDESNHGAPKGRFLIRQGEAHISEKF